MKDTKLIVGCLGFCAAVSVGILCGACTYVALSWLSLAHTKSVAYSVASAFFVCIASMLFISIWVHQVSPSKIEGQTMRSTIAGIQLGCAAGISASDNMWRVLIVCLVFGFCGYLTGVGAVAFASWLQKRSAGSKNDIGI